MPACGGIPARKGPADRRKSLAVSHRAPSEAEVLSVASVGAQLYVARMFESGELLAYVRASEVRTCARTYPPVLPHVPLASCNRCDQFVRTYPRVRQGTRCVLPHV